ncbi:MAG TPA: hypothetical protein VF730_13750 [Terracidiphilus sp.]
MLPLLNESGDASQDYFSDGLSQELISALGQVHALKVIGRNSSFQFRGRAQDDTVVARLKKERNFLCDAAAFFAQGIALRY